MIGSKVNDHNSSKWPDVRATSISISLSLIRDPGIWVTSISISTRLYSPHSVISPLKSQYANISLYQKIIYPQIIPICHPSTQACSQKTSYAIAIEPHTFTILSMTRPYAITSSFLAVAKHKYLGPKNSSYAIAMHKQTQHFAVTVFPYEIMMNKSLSAQLLHDLVSSTAIVMQTTNWGTSNSN